MKPINASDAAKFLFRAVVAPGFFLLLAGEAFFRIPAAGRQVVYDFDPELGKRLAPSQTGGMWVGNMAFLSPPMTFNSEGFRNPETSPGARAILCLGSSETLGSGVEDTEVWTSPLTDSLSVLAGTRLWALNGGNPGYGPFHSSVILERTLAKRALDLVVVRISMGDRNFIRPDSVRIADYKRTMERNARIKHVTLFLPFLIDKTRAQWASIKAVFSISKAEKVYARENETREGAARMFRRQEQYFARMAEMCRAAGVPLLFAIIDPIGTEAGSELRERFAAAFGGGSGAHVLLIDNAHFGLTEGDQEERRKAFLKAYTLVVDPHANAAQHAIIARAIHAAIVRDGLLRGASPAPSVVGAGEARDPAAAPRERD